MRRLLTLLVMILSTVVAWGQTTISGRFFDAETKEGVMGAIVEITSPRDSLFRRHYTTGYGGYFKSGNLPRGEYKLTSSFLGYEDYERKFKVEALPVNLGSMAMKQQAINVGLVVKEVRVPRAQIMGDTLRYTASNFKVTVDAELEQLLRKLPGISINNGRIEAQGEVVKQIYVDNKEFFGGNIQQVLQSIPAQAVESIEVYNRMSDAAQITGVDDGEGGKVINIITKGSLSHSEFGKVHAATGVGNDRTPLNVATGALGDYTDRLKWRYSVGGSMNIFRDDMRISIMALTNNLNKQNLSDEGISMSGSTNRTNASSSFSVNRQSGVASADIFAVNYSDRWGKRKRAKFDGNVFFNHNNSINNFRLDRWYNAPSKIDTIHYDQFSNPNNLQLRFRGRLDWKVAKRQRLNLTPTYRYTNNFSINEQRDTTSFRTPGSENGLRYYPSYNEGRYEQHNLGLSGHYSYNFLKQGRVFLVSGSISHTTSESWRNYSSYSGKELDMAKRKYSYSYNNTKDTITTYRINPSFREKIGRHTAINLSYNFQCQLRERDVANYNTDKDYTLLPEKLKSRNSSIYTGRYLFHEATAGMRYGRGKNWFSINLRYRNTELATIYHGVPGKLLETPQVRSKFYNNFLYNVTVNISANKKHSFRAALNSKMRVPGIWALTDIYNVNNTSYISVGNPNLKPAQEHNAFVRYTNVSPRFGTTFMIMAKAEHIQDYIGNKIAYSPGKISLPDYPAPTPEDPNKMHMASFTPMQISQQTNLDGYWSYEFRTSLGLPLKHLRSNLNLVLGGTYSDIPMAVVKADLPVDEIIDPKSYEFIGAADNVMMHNTNAYAQATLGSNISENVDFTITWRGTYSYNNSTLSDFNNKYFMHYLRGNIKAVLPLGFTITSSVNFTHFKVFTHNFNDMFVLWNLSVGKKVLNGLGEVELCIDDVLNQNTSFGRYVIANYSQLRYNTVLGRTFLAKFTYNIRNLGGAKRRMKWNNTPQDPLGDVQSKLDALRF